MISEDKFTYLGHTVQTVIGLKKNLAILGKNEGSKRVKTMMSWTGGIRDITGMSCDLKAQHANIST